MFRKGVVFVQPLPLPGNCSSNCSLGLYSVTVMDQQHGMCAKKHEQSKKFHTHDGSMYAIYGNMDPINIPPMLAYIPSMDPMG